MSRKIYKHTKMFGTELTKKNGVYQVSIPIQGIMFMETFFLLAPQSGALRRGT